MTLLNDARMARQYARGLREFYHTRIDLTDAAGTIRGMLATREARFIGTLQQAVWEHPTSPYLALLRHAGVERKELAALVAREGVEGALRQL